MATEIEKAKAEYKTADEKTKTVLENIFGKETFINSDEWMKLWEKFQKENNLNFALPYPNPQNSDEEWIDANFMMMHIIRKKRKSTPNWNNSSEYKYTPYFDMRASSGFGFSGSAAYYGNAYAFVASRLCFPADRDLALSVAKKYEPIYEKIMKE